MHVCLSTACSALEAVQGETVVQVETGFRFGLVSLVASGQQKEWIAWRLPPGSQEGAWAMHKQVRHLLASTLQPYVAQLRRGLVQLKTILDGLHTTSGENHSHGPESAGVPLCGVTFHTAHDLDHSQCTSSGICLKTAGRGAAAVGGADDLASSPAWGPPRRPAGRTDLQCDGFTTEIII